jgi:putative ABC transport system permease protein
VTVVVGLVTGLVLAFVAAATVFYVSAAGSAAAQYAVGHRCATDNGLHLGVAKADPWRDSTVAQARSVATRYGGDVFHTRAYSGMGPLDPVVLLSRNGAFDNVRVLAGGNRDGVWIPGDVAAQFHLAPGDPISLAGVPVPVGAVFQLMSDPVAPFWCADRNYAVPDPAKGANGPPATYLVSSRLLDSIIKGRGFRPLEAHLDVSTSRPLTTNTQAADWARDTAAMRPALVATLGAGNPAVTDYAALSARTTERTQATMWAAVSPLTVISVLAGLLGVIGLASQWTQRRGTEVRLLWTRGVRPAAIGGKAVLEMGTPLLAGGVLGWAAAWLTAPLLAPATVYDPWAPGLAALLALGVWLVALGVLGVSTGLRVRREFTAVERKPLLRWVNRVPWEVLAGVAAVVLWTTGDGQAVQVDPSDLLPDVSLAALAFPLLCMVFFVGIVARLAGFLSRASHRLRGWRSPTVLWALRRTAAQRQVAVALLVVAGLAIGVIAAGVGIARTERESLADKSWTRIGADHAITMTHSAGAPEGVPASVAGEATRIAYTQVFVHDNITARVLLVDPVTFANGARWRDRWAGARLADLLSKLDIPRPDGSVPVLVVGRYPLAQYVGQGAVVPKTTGVASVASFPGMGPYDGMLVASWKSVTPDMRRGYVQQVLTNGDPARVAAAMNAAGEPTARVLDAARSTDELPFLVVAWIFAFFVVLGFALAAVAVVTLLVSVETRRRSTAVAHALLARMGLRARALLATHLVELSILAGTATVVGVGGGWAILAMVTRRLDPYPLANPIPQPASLDTVGLITFAVAAIGVVLVAVYAVRSARRAKVKELLRA